MLALDNRIGSDLRFAWNLTLHGRVYAGSISGVAQPVVGTFDQAVYLFTARQRHMTVDAPIFQRKRPPIVATKKSDGLAANRARHRFLPAHFPIPSCDIPKITRINHGVPLAAIMKRAYAAIKGIDW